MDVSHLCHEKTPSSFAGGKNLIS